MSNVIQKEQDIRDDIGWAKINRDVLASLERPRATYWLLFAFAFGLFVIGLSCEAYQYNRGMGVSGMNNPDVWSLYIATFIFWIGMGHSGTLLSALLHIIHADWRKPVYRYAEAMTTFSLITAACFVFMHLGRLWEVYYALPYPNERWTWPNFQSPLAWDCMAILTYLTSSVLFLVVGSIPDMAICRDAATGWRKTFYGWAALGWKGTDRQWRNFRVTYLAMACFLMPLAVSVHSIVSSDFAMSQQPGWHITSFPPYFVAGALYSGCAVIITLFIMLRYVFRFEEYMTIPILEKLSRLTFAISMVWTYLNLCEYSTVWYGNDLVSKETLIMRATGPYAGWWWAMNILGSVLPLVLISKKVRTSIPIMLVLSLVFNFAMWDERWMIVTPTFSHGYYPWTWDHKFFPSMIQWGILLGSFGLFGMLFMLFVKIFPSVSMYEVKEMVHATRHEKLHAHEREA